MVRESGVNEPAAARGKAREFQETSGTIALPKVQKLAGHEDAVLTLAFGAGSLFSGGKDQTIKRWHLETGNFTRTLTGHRKCVSSLALSPDGRVPVSGSDDRAIRVWQVA